MWDPPAQAPAWLDEPGDPWVIVTLDVGAPAARLRASGGAQRFAEAAEELVLEAHRNDSFRDEGAVSPPVIGRTAAV